MANLPRFSVRHSLPVNLLSIFLVLAGGLTLLHTRREAFPTFSFDIVSIRTSYPGATPEEVEKLITQPIEQEIQGIADLDKITSVSAEGYSLIYVEIDPDARDKRKVVTDLQQAVDRVPDFPADLQDAPITEEIRTEDSPIIEVALSGPLSRKVLQDLGENLEDLLEDLPDVATVDHSGWLKDQMWVELDPFKLKDHRVSIIEVVAAIRARHINVPGGTIDTGRKEFLVRTNAEFETPEEIDNIVIRSNEVGKTVLVRDVGKARWAFQDASILSRVDGSEAIRLVVVKHARGDVIRMVSEVKRVVDEFVETAPKELHVAYVNDVSYYVKRRLGILLNNSWIGLILVLISLFIFLSRPVAVWTMVGLPVAIGGGLWMMTAFDVTVNLISMFGLIMVLGIVVDDAIVVAENIYRYIELGYNKREAAIRGANEVLMPVTVTVLTTIVAFLPLAFMSGILGKFVFSIPVVVILMLMASWLESFTILPSHLADFAGTARNGIENGMRKRRTLYVRFEGLYLRLLRWMLRWRNIVTPATLAGVAMGIYLCFQFIPLNLFPGKGIEIFFVRAETEIGTSLEETTRRLQRVEKVIAKLPPDELKNFVTIAGLVQQDPHDPFSVRGSHVGQIVVYLTPENSRERSAYDIMNQMRSRIEKIPGFERIWLDEVKPGPPAGKPIAVRIRGEELEVSKGISLRIQEDLKKISGVRDIRDDFEPGKQELRVRIKERETAQASLTPSMIARTVRAAFEGEVAAVVRKGEDDIDVLVRLVEGARARPEQIMSLYVENPRGFHVPIDRVASVEWGEGISAIKHSNLKRVITVTANVDESVTTSYLVNKILEEKYADLSKEHRGYTLTFGGQQEDTDESLESLRRAFILAAILIFFILASAFNSPVQPFVIMLAIPYGLLTAMLALMAHGEPLSFLAFLGLIGLAGVTVNDSIILTDFINRKRKEDGIRREAIVEACRTRLRPVILTSVTTVGGLAPVAYGLGGLDPFLKPMALTIVWGIFLGTGLTLLLVPTAYAVTDDLVERVWRRPRRERLIN